MQTIQCRKNAEDVEEFCKSNPTSSGTSGTSGQNATQKSAEQEWKESANETLRALTQMMQASQATQQAEKAPPVPPRPVMSGTSTTSDDTIPKQRPLPSAPIPKRPRQRAGDGEGRAYEFSTTYQDFESVDNSGEEYFSDDDRPDTSEAD
jgi:hypothetical protein